MKAQIHENEINYHILVRVIEYLWINLCQIKKLVYPQNYLFTF